MPGTATSILIPSFASTFLEHIEDELGALTAMHRLFNMGGHLCLFVPALPCLYGTLDVSFGHYRRYSKSHLEKLVKDAGFVIEKVKFFNLLGIATWLLMEKLLRWKTWGIYPTVANDRIVIPVMRRIETFWAPPFGQSLLLVARKT